jgi:nucleoside-diphosphate-sugar epimerase
MPRLLCLGLGSTALALADRLIPQGWSVAGTTRSAAKAASLQARGIDATAGEADLAGATHLLVSVPPDETGDPALRRCGEAIRTHGEFAWIGYLSATSVYGDRQGAWVDETTEPHPVGPRGARRLAAEAAWRALDPPAHVFRLAGLYGPGQSALDAVRAGRIQRVDLPGLAFSRVHYDDVAVVLAASIARPRPGAIYNVADDLPAPPSEVTAFACRLLGIEPPAPVPLDQAALSPMGREFYAENKRVSNKLIKAELGVTLAYPDYRVGLTALLAAGR